MSSDARAPLPPASEIGARAAEGEGGSPGGARGAWAETRVPGDAAAPSLAGTPRPSRGRDGGGRSLPCASRPVARP